MASVDEKSSVVFCCSVASARASHVECATLKSAFQLVFGMLWPCKSHTHGDFRESHEFPNHIESIWLNLALISRLNDVDMVEILTWIWLNRFHVLVPGAA
jgi:hypothetical protein